MGAVLTRVCPDGWSGQAPTQRGPSCGWAQLRTPVPSGVWGLGRAAVQSTASRGHQRLRPGRGSGRHARAHTCSRAASPACVLSDAQLQVLVPNPLRHAPRPSQPASASRLPHEKRGLLSRPAVLCRGPSGPGRSLRVAVRPTRWDWHAFHASSLQLVRPGAEDKPRQVPGRACPPGSAQRPEGWLPSSPNKADGDAATPVAAEAALSRWHRDGVALSA